jgi:hypothetical protein
MAPCIIDFIEGECITWASRGEGALDTPGPQRNYVENGEFLIFENMVPVAGNFVSTLPVILGQTGTEQVRSLPQDAARDQRSQHEASSGECLP